MQLFMDPVLRLILLLIVSGAGAYFGSYLKKRGKNLATKEDIGAITEKVESIRAIYAADLEDRKAAHQLRTACLDKRLLAHQEAYALWLKLVHHLHQEDGYNVVSECQTWWNKNCLFLDENPRKAFLAAFRLAHQHKDLARSRIDPKVVYENWDKIIAAGPTIEAAVGLPPIIEVLPDKPKATA